MNFWQELKKNKKPFFALAPMADVTDMAFRQIICETGRPDVFYTEFVSAAGLCSEKGRPKLLPHFKFGENERPIVAQIFGSVPKHFYECAKLIVELGFDGIDINMGCPASKIMKQDSGAGLILNPELAKEIIRETKRGSGDLPVSVKTRIGYGTIVTEEWISHLIEATPAAIIIHGRTAKEMSKVPAHWDEIAKAAKLCRAAGIPIIGNGDILDYADGLQKAEECGLGGIMVGRGIFSNPWFFNAEQVEHSKEERINLLKTHISNFINLWVSPSHLVGEVENGLRQSPTRCEGQPKNFAQMKRFFKVYISGFEGSKELRDKLMQTKTASESLAILDQKP